VGPLCVEARTELGGGGGGGLYGGLNFLFFHRMAFLFSLSLSLFLFLSRRVVCVAYSNRKMNHLTPPRGVVVRGCFGIFRLLSLLWFGGNSIITIVEIPLVG